MQTLLVDAQSSFPNPLEKQFLLLTVIASRLAKPAGEARPEPRRSGSSLRHRTSVVSGVSWGAGRQSALALLDMLKTWAEARGCAFPSPLLPLARPWEEAPEGTGSKAGYIVSPQNFPGNSIPGPPKINLPPSFSPSFFTSFPSPPLSSMLEESNSSPEQARPQTSPHLVFLPHSEPPYCPPLRQRVPQCYPVPGSLEAS